MKQFATDRAEPTTSTATPMPAPGRRAMTDRFGPVRAAASSTSSLDGSTASALGDHLGADFSSVRVHTGGEVDHALAGAGARAATLGDDVYFRTGEYAPGTSHGCALIAHELAHVEQQRAGRASGMQAKDEGGGASDAHELEADLRAAAVGGALIGAGPEHASWARPVRVRVKADVNVRSTPKVAGDNRVGGLDRGSEVDAVGKDGEWLLIQSAHVQGYVHGRFVEQVGSVAERVGHAHAPAPAPHPAPAPAPHPAPHPAPTPAPAPVADQGFDSLLAQALATGTPSVIAIANELTEARRLFDANIPKSRDNHFEQRPEIRQQLVAHAQSIRAQIAAAGDQVPAALRVGFFRAIADLNPYYQQQNLDIIHDRAVGTTCNITSLSMALESLGKTPRSYLRKENEQKLVAAAGLYESWKAQILAENPLHWDKDAMAGYRDRNQAAPIDSLDKVYALRMPDFMQLVVMAQNMSEATVAEAGKIRGKAVETIESWSTIEKLAADFGCKSYDESLGGDTSKALNAYGKTHRKGAEAAADEDNHRVDRGDSKAHDALADQGRAGQHDGDIDQTVELGSYQQRVIAQVGRHLDAGHAVIACIYNHFVRLQAIHPDFVVFDDPGDWNRHDFKVSWELARSMGAFLAWLVLEPS